MKFQPGHVPWNKGKHTGLIPWNEGKKTGPLSAETKAKLRAAQLGRHPSEATRAKIGAAQLGQRGPASRSWKGGRPLTEEGYRLIWKPNHPAADKKGYVREHRLIAEKILGRPLEPAEVPHHVNEDKLDQHRENLIVCKNKSYHSIIHRRHLTPATIDRTRAIWLGEIQ